MEFIKRQCKQDWPEIKQLAFLGAPVFIALASNRSLSTVSLSFVGSIGASELAAAGLATSLANVTGESMLIGLASAMQTLCGQAFGAKAFHEVGNISQRALMVLWAACVPITLLWWFSEPLLLVIGQDPHVSQLCATFLRWRLPGVWAYALFSSIQGFLQAQRIVNPPAVGNLLSALLHPAVTHLLINTVGLGFAGAAAAYSVSNIMECVLLLAIVVFNKMHQQCWGGFSAVAFQKWGQYLWLALPSLVMLGEWWSSEITTVIAGRLPDPDKSLSAMSIFQQTDALAFMLPLGLGIAVAVRTANEVGAGRMKEARHAAAVGVRLAVVIASVLGLSILLSRTQLVQVYTGDRALLQVASNVLIIMSAYIGLDGLQTILSGILRGTGRQAYAAPVIVFSYFIVGLPVALLLCFTFKLGVYGLCTGMFVGSVVNCSLYAYLTVTTPWEQVLAEAKQRSGKEGDETEQLTNGESHEEDSQA